MRASTTTKKSKWICHDSNAGSPIKQGRYVKFDPNLKATPNRDKENSLGSFFSQKDLQWGSYFLNDLSRRNETTMRMLSLNDFEIPNNNENKELQLNRNNSMFELEIQRLLEDEEEDLALTQPSESGSGNQVTKSAGTRSRSLSTINYLGRSRQSSVNKKKETLPPKPQIKRTNYPVRRKSCTCKQCGQSTKLAKASTIILAEDFEKRNLNQGSKKSKPNPQLSSPSTFKRKSFFRYSTIIPGTVLQASNRTGNKVYQAVQLNRYVQKFSAVLDKKEPESAGGKVGRSSGARTLQVLGENNARVKIPQSENARVIKCDTAEKKPAKSLRMVESEAVFSVQHNKRKKKTQKPDNPLSNRRYSLRSYPEIQISGSKKKSSLATVTESYGLASNLQERAEPIVSLNELSERYDQNRIETIFSTGECASSVSIQTASKETIKALKQNPSRTVVSQDSRGNITTIPSVTDLNGGSHQRFDTVLPADKIILMTDPTPRERITKRQWLSENNFERKAGQVTVAKTPKKGVIRSTFYEKYGEGYNPNWHSNINDSKLPSLQYLMNLHSKFNGYNYIGRG